MYCNRLVSYALHANAHIMENLVSLVAADGVDLVTIVDGMVTELVLDGGQLSTGLEAGSKGK